MVETQPFLNADEIAANIIASSPSMRVECDTDPSGLSRASTVASTVLQDDMQQPCSLEVLGLSPAPVPQEDDSLATDLGSFLDECKDAEMPLGPFGQHGEIAPTTVLEDTGSMHQAVSRQDDCSKDTDAEMPTVQQGPPKQDGEILPGSVSRDTSKPSKRVAGKQPDEFSVLDYKVQSHILRNTPVFASLNPKPL